MDKKMSIKQMMKEIEELEPKNVIDYIFKGSGFNQFIKRHKLEGKWKKDKFMMNSIKCSG